MPHPEGMVESQPMCEKCQVALVQIIVSTTQNPDQIIDALRCPDCGTVYYGDDENG
jgi:hypothetical protein